MITKTTIRNSVFVFLILVAVLVYALVFALTSASAQTPARLGDLMPAGDYRAAGRPLPPEAVAALRAAPVVGVATPDYARDIWTDLSGNPLGVTRWERAITIDFNDGGTPLDAVLAFGNTRDPGRTIATVAYAAAGWHCRGAVVVERAAVEGGAR